MEDACYQSEIIDDEVEKGNIENEVEKDINDHRRDNEVMKKFIMYIKDNVTHKVIKHKLQIIPYIFLHKIFDRLMIWRRWRSGAARPSKLGGRETWVVGIKKFKKRCQPLKVTRRVLDWNAKCTGNKWQRSIFL